MHKKKVSQQTTHRNARRRRQTLKSLCEANVSLNQYFKPGIKAIKNEYRNRIIVSDPKLFGGSIDFDTALKEKHNTDNRWDYGFDYDGYFIFIEFHPAQTSEVDCMIKKVEFISKWLKENCPDILQLPKFEKENRLFYWVATKRNGILKLSKEARKLAVNHIKHVGFNFDYEKIKAEQS